MRLDKKKIFLGTAQFLSNYGIVNTNKNKSYKHFLKILEYAGENDIFNYDTAPGYNSEKIIGEFIYANRLKNIKILTKIPKIIGSDYKKFVEKSIEKSINLLNSKIYTIFFHNPSDVKFFLNDPKFFLNLKKEYSIKNIGFSVYKVSDIKEVINQKFEVSIQFPFNILNQSFLPLFTNEKISPLFARSIFLQGILLKKIENKKVNLDLIKSANKYLNILKNKNISPLEFSLSFIHQNEKLNYYIFGIENLNQLKDIISCNFSKFDNNNYNELKYLFKKKLIDPRNW